MTLESRVRGGLVGLLVGDALGVPYEFHDPANLPPAAEIEMEPPAGFNRSHRSAPSGTWSDDGAQALALLATLLAHGGLDVEDLGARFRRWYVEGELAVDRHVFDIGNQTGEALDRIGKQPAETCGNTGEYDNGNGSAMRVLPLALWHTGSDAALVRDAMRQSRITHGHARSQVACGLLVLWGRALLDGLDADAAFDRAVRGMRALDVDASELQRFVDPYEPRGTGYVLDSLHSVRVALRAGGYEAVVKRAIQFGHDTDTTACIAGGLAGIRDGLEAIPTRWRRALRGQDLLAPLLEGLVAHRLAGAS
jgi:ADP-ribosylglycohydrolase